jgi:hypothetical protein
MAKDYFAVLGVGRNATSEQIKQAYREQARRYHPDLNSSPDASQRFQEVVEAYETLSDPLKRAEYVVTTFRKKAPSATSPWNKQNRQRGHAIYWANIGMVLLGLSILGWALEGWRGLASIALAAEATTCQVQAWQQIDQDTYQLSYLAFNVPWQSVPFQSWRYFDESREGDFPIGRQFTCYYNLDWQATHLYRYEMPQVLRYLPWAIFGLALILRGGYVLLR